MAKIVFIFHDFWGCQREEKFVYPPFYDGLIQEFLKNGNNVYCYIRPIVNIKFDFSGTIPSDLLKELQQIDPDLFIIVNNQFWDVSAYFQCPIVCYSVDSPLFYGNLDVLKQKKDRFKFVVQQSAEINLLNEIIGPKSNNVELIFPVSPINPLNVPKKVNISFLGSQWIWEGLPALYEYMKKKPTREDAILARRIHEKILDGIDYTNIIKDLQKQYKKLPKPKLVIKNNYLYVARMSGLKRAQYLSMLSDLGLEIYGNFWTTSCMAYFPDLVLSYIARPIVTKHEVEELYNQSKICFQLNHIQAQSGFSWKIADIMSSSGCLVTNFTKDFHLLFGANIPTFTSACEARELCMKILNNQSMREDIVGYSNEKAEEFFKPLRALKQLESLTDVKLVNNSNFLGCLNCKMFSISMDTKKEKEDQKKKFHGLTKFKYKIWRHLNKEFKLYNQ